LARLLRLTRHYIRAPDRGPARHVLATIRTIQLLIQYRPRLVWYQFSWALGVSLWLYALFSGGRVRLVADVHSKALRRKGIVLFRWPLHALKRRALRRCGAVLVSNERDRADALGRFGVASLVLPDPLPDVPALLGSAAPSPEVVFVCSFAVDEPLDLIIETAERLRGRAGVAITGNVRSAPTRRRKALRRTGALTGFLPESRYWDLLRAARAIVVLSREPGCLPCGAYEAIAAGKRPIIADDRLARATFGDSAHYVRFDPADVADAALRSIAAKAEPAIGTGYYEHWCRTWAEVQPALRAAAGLPPT
jgi:glycosyltransferase involved in cell wall biosynthesis